MSSLILLDVFTKCSCWDFVCSVCSLLFGGEEEDERGAHLGAKETERRVAGGALKVAYGSWSMEDDPLEGDAEMERTRAADERGSQKNIQRAPARARRSNENRMVHNF